MKIAKLAERSPVRRGCTLNGSGLIFAILWLLLLPSLSFAWNEPNGFLDVPWGSSEEVLRQKIPVTACKALNIRAMPERKCSGEVRLGAVLADAAYLFRSNRFVAVSLGFKPEDFLSVEASFRQQYGPPSEPEEVRKVGPPGRQYTRRVLRWVGIAVSIELNERPSESDALIKTKAEYEEVRRQLKEILGAAPGRKPFEGGTEVRLVGTVRLWKSPVAYESQRDDSVSCVVPHGTKAAVQRAPRSWMWDTVVLEGPDTGCRGVIHPDNFKTEQEIQAEADRPRREAEERARQQAEQKRLQAEAEAKRAQVEAKTQIWAALPPVERSAARDALRALKALQSVTRVGVTYQDYMRRLGDTVIVVDRAFEGIKEQGLRSSIRRTMFYYEQIGSLWNAKIQKYPLATYLQSAADDCSAARELLARARLEKYPEIHIEVRAVQTMMACASDKLAELDRGLQDNKVNSQKGT